VTASVDRIDLLNKLFPDRCVHFICSLHLIALFIVTLLCTPVLCLSACSDYRLSGQVVNVGNSSMDIQMDVDSVKGNTAVFVTNLSNTEQMASG
jgi:hypothetical protein